MFTSPPRSEVSFPSHFTDALIPSSPTRPTIPRDAPISGSVSLQTDNYVPPTSSFAPAQPTDNVLPLPHSPSKDDGRGSSRVHAHDSGSIVSDSPRPESAEDSPQYTALDESPKPIPDPSGTTALGLPDTHNLSIWFVIQLGFSQLAAQFLITMEFSYNALLFNVLGTPPGLYAVLWLVGPLAGFMH